MVLTARVYAGCVLAASVAVLGGALLSQYWGGLPPCELCLLQRWPWSIAIAIAAVALAVGERAARPWLALLLAVTFLVGAAFAAYHVGVEQRWIAGPTACTGGGAGATTVEELRRQILATAPVRCDEVPWSLFGVSLAGWNLLASLAMAVFSASAFGWSRRVPAANPHARRGVA